MKTTFYSMIVVCVGLFFGAFFIMAAEKGGVPGIGAALAWGVAFLCVWILKSIWQRPLSGRKMGWYRDPYGRYESRLWNGKAWTAHVMTSRDYVGHVGDPAIDPYGSEPNCYSKGDQYPWSSENNDPRRY